MLLDQWAIVLTQSFQDLSYGLIQFIPRLVAALIIFIIGWLVGVGLGRLVAQIVSSIRVDEALRSAGVEKVVQRAGWKLNSGAFLGALVKWFVIIVFLVAALDALQLTAVTLFLSTVVLTYLPHVIVAVLILLVAAVIADAAERVVSGSAAAANITSANFLGALSRWAIWIFAILAALDQLGVTPFIQTLFTGLVVALSLAFGLAFGLGGQHAAAEYIKKLQNEIK
jgi:small-conductance mechanosensitive channel